MKTHAIIPIFIPHEGCPNDCVFCNQKKITARQSAMPPQEIGAFIEKYLETLQGRGLNTIEVAFFGGSFTGLPLDLQGEYLKEVFHYKITGRIHKIRLSTRPDYINEEILALLKKFQVDIIELGIQSFDDEVLLASSRGHDSRTAVSACKLVKSWGFELGIQLMIGLPKDSLEKCIYSAKIAVSLEPAMARLYPTIIIEETELMNMYRSGIYKPLSLQDAVNITKEMYKILQGAGVTILRVGLKSTDIINDGGAISGSTYHPAFRQLVEGEIAREILEKQLVDFIDPDRSGCITTKNFEFRSNGPSFSNMIGHSGCNKKYFAGSYPYIKIKYSLCNSLADYEYIVVKC